MRKGGIKFSNSSLMREAFIVSKGGERKISKLSSYKEGKIYMQNLSSMLPPLFLDLEKDINILDMCAAPGSKTTEMAAMLNNRCKIIANEIDDISENLKEIGNYTLKITKGAKDILIDEGFNDKYGARPLKRILTKLIENPISELILNKKLNEGEIINVKTVGGDIKIETK